MIHINRVVRTTLAIVVGVIALTFIGANISSAQLGDLHLVDREHLLGYFPLNTGSGVTTHTVLGYSRTANLFNGVTWDGGISGNAVDFDGVDDYINLGPYAGIEGGGMALSAWVLLQDASDCVEEECFIISRALFDDVSGTYTSLGVKQIDNSPLISFKLKAGGVTTELLSSGASLPLDKWTHLAAIFDGSQMLLFIDGTQVAATPKGGAIDITTAPVYLSRHVDRTGTWNGLIDEVYIWNRALLAQEARNLFINIPQGTQVNAPVVTPEPDPVVVEYDCTLADTVRDGIVNILDVQHVLNGGGESCRLATTCEIDLNRDGYLNDLDTDYMRMCLNRTTVDSAGLEDCIPEGEAEASGFIGTGCETLPGGVFGSTPNECAVADLVPSGYIDALDFQSLLNGRSNDACLISHPDCTADVNSDGKVNDVDADHVTACLGTVVPIPVSPILTCADADIVEDGTINILDVQFVLNHLEETCSFAADCPYDVVRDTRINKADSEFILSCLGESIADDAPRSDLTFSCTDADIVEDGTINILDVQFVLNHDGETCGVGEDCPYDVVRDTRINKADSEFITACFSPAPEPEAEPVVCEPIDIEALTIEEVEIVGVDPDFVFTQSLFQNMRHPDVLQLQIFLNSNGFTLVQDGPGSPGNETNYYGELTRRAVTQFQHTHRFEVLIPLGLLTPTGFFGPSSIEKANELLASTASEEIVTVIEPTIVTDPITGCDVVHVEIPDAPASSVTPDFVFTQNLVSGMRHPDVLQLQIFLNNNGFTVAQDGPGSPGNETNYYGELTRRAVTQFQQTHRFEVLIPLGLLTPTGFFGPSSIDKANELLAAP